MPINFFSPAEQPDPIVSYREYDAAFTALDVVIMDIKAKRKALGEKAREQYQENIDRDPENLAEPLPDNFLSAAKQRQFLRIMVENLRGFKDQVFHDAHHTFKDDPAGTARLAHNIREVNKAISILINDAESQERRLAAINNLRYKASRWEPTFTTLKKIVRVLCAAAIGFLLGAIAGITLSGGIATLPTAIMMSFKNTLAAYAGAGAAVAFGPFFTAVVSAKKEFKQKTNSPVERNMIWMQNSLKSILESKPTPQDLLTRARNFIERQVTVSIGPQNRRPSL